MSKKSCVTNLLEFLETITDYTDKGYNLDLIYLDFAKAFDKVPTLRLLEKLSAHSVGGNILRWIKNWLSDRVQRVVLNGSTSTWKEVLSGVPQGSVLGPLLFIIFINDIDDAVDTITIIKKFADDTKIGQIITRRDDSLNLQRALDNLTDWANKWKMNFNTDKCKTMHIGRKNDQSEYLMNGQKLSKTEKEKDIGVMIHRTLKPSHQCGEAARKAKAVLLQIVRTFHYRDKKNLSETVYNLCETPPGIFCFCLEPLASERRGYPGGCSKKGYQDDLRPPRSKL